MLYGNMRIKWQQGTAIDDPEFAIDWKTTSGPHGDIAPLVCLGCSVTTPNMDRGVFWKIEKEVAARREKLEWFKTAAR